MLAEESAMENGCTEVRKKERRQERKNCKSGEPKSRKIVNWQDKETRMLCAAVLRGLNLNPS